MLLGQIQLFFLHRIRVLEYIIVLSKSLSYEQRMGYFMSITNLFKLVACLMLVSKLNK